MSQKIPKMSQNAKNKLLSKKGKQFFELYNDFHKLLTLTTAKAGVCNFRFHLL